jgi:hypothetical protein
MHSRLRRSTFLQLSRRHPTLRTEHHTNYKTTNRKILDTHKGSLTIKI